MQVTTVVVSRVGEGRDPEPGAMGGAGQMGMMGGSHHDMMQGMMKMMMQMHGGMMGGGMGCRWTDGSDGSGHDVPHAWVDDGSI